MSGLTRHFIGLAVFALLVAGFYWIWTDIFPMIPQHLRDVRWLRSFFSEFMILIAVLGAFLVLSLVQLLWDKLSRDSDKKVTI